MEAKGKNNPCYKVVVKKVIAADRERVFDAWTKPELMNRWFVGAKGTARTQVDLRVGGRYANEMLIEGDCAHSSQNPSESKAACSYHHDGEYLEIKRPERIVFTWNSPSVRDTTVTVELKTVSGGTEVTLTHELPSKEECESHQMGWTYALSTLAALESVEKS